VFVQDYVTDGDRSKPKALKHDKLKGKERVLCFAAGDGKSLWQYEYDCPYDVSYPAGPRCTPTVTAGKVYALGTMGPLHCLDAATGRVAWAHDFPKEYGAKIPIWGCSGHPLVVGQKVIVPVGGEGSVLVAFDKDTGQEVWRALSAKEIGYRPPPPIGGGGPKQGGPWGNHRPKGAGPGAGQAPLAG